MRKVVSTLFLIITVLCAIALLFANFAPLVNPQEFWFFTIFGLLFPLFLFLNFYLFIHWIFYKRIYFLIPLLVLVFSFNNAKKLFSFSDLIKPNEKTESFTVLSYNVKNLDVYNAKSKVATRKKIKELIIKEAPDLLCMQEFYTKDNSDFDNLNYFDEHLDYNYKYYNSKYNYKNVHHFGVVTYSKYPIIKQGNVKFYNTDFNSCIFTDVLIEGDTLRLYNAHFQSFQFRSADYEVAKQINNIEKVDIEATKSTLKKLKNAYIKRSEQTHLIAKHISNSPHKAIIVGDFNDTPVSFTYNVFSKTMTDAYLAAGAGLGGTYNGPLPSFRIDYMFSDKKINIHEFKVLKNNLSDHYAIKAKFSF